MLKYIIPLILICDTSTVFGQSYPQRNHFNVKRTVAIEGYDPVSYFKGTPREGNKDIEYEYKGITYRFSSKENLMDFMKNPEKYEPQFGGWCAYAVGNSAEKVKINPKTFTVVDEKLYLFYNSRNTNTLLFWKENEDQLMGKAEKNWKKMTGQ